MTEKKQVWEQVSLWVGILIAVGVAWWLTRHYEVVEIWIRSAGWWGPLVAIGLYALLSLTPIPSDPLTLINGVIFGWGPGLMISWMGNNAAALVEYLIFRDVQSLTQFSAEKKSLPKWLKRWPVQSPLFLIGGRFVPGFGGKIVSVMAGMYKVPWWRFLWTTAVANLIGSIGWAAGGWGLIKLF